VSSDSDTEMIFSGQSFAYTLVHGDFHGSNVLVTRADTTDGGSLTTNGGVGGPSVFVIDFQTVALGECTQDIGYLMAMSLSPHDRREHEERILRRYWGYLVAHGVDQDGFPFELCFLRYQLWGILKWAWILMVLDMLQKSKTGPDGEELGVHNVVLMVTRLEAFLEDHGDPRVIMQKSLALSAKLAAERK
jgi:thiamine kinase-like enzyme